MADRYWVGGTANWDATALLKWSSTSGGLGGETVPTAADDVYIDSGSGVVTVTAAATNACRSLSFTSESGDFAGTFAGSSALSVAGSLTLSASMTVTYTGVISFTATNAQTITSNGVALNSNLTFNGVGGAWQLQDNLTTGTTRTFTLTNGEIDLNNLTLSAGLFRSNNSNVRSIAFGTGKIVLTDNSTVIADTTTQTNFSYTGSGLIESNYSGSTGTRSFNIGRLTGVTESNALNLSITAGSDTIAFANIQRIKNLTFSNFTGQVTATQRILFGSLTLSPGMTTISGAANFTFSATTLGNTITTNGVAINHPLIFDGVGGEWILQDDLTLENIRIITLTNGTFNANNYNVTSARFNSSNTNTRSLLMGSSTFTLKDTANSTTVWQFGLASTGLTVVPGTSKIVVDAGASTLTILNLGETAFNNVEILTGTNIRFNGGGAINRLTNVVTPLEVSFNPNLTYLFTDFALSGAGVDRLTIASSTPGSQYTLSQPSGIVSVSNATISDSAAIGGATWNARTDLGAKDMGNNTGWNFIFIGVKQILNTILKNILSTILVK